MAMETGQLAFQGEDRQQADHSAAAEAAVSKPEAARMTLTKTQRQRHRYPHCLTSLNMASPATDATSAQLGIARNSLLCCHALKRGSSHVGASIRASSRRGQTLVPPSC